MTLHKPAFALLLVAALGCGSADGEPPQVAPPPTQPVADPRISEMQVLLVELLDRIEVLNARIQRLESGPPASAPTPAAATAVQSRSLTSAAIADKYRNALATYGKGGLDEAQRLFQEVLDADPGGQLADNALYWIGETYFVRAKYPEAMNFYRRILKDYSEENKAPDAMFKIGLSYARLGDLALARTTFLQLIEKYPYSTPASSAKAEIKRIKY